MVPSGNWAVVGTPSGSPVEVPGILNASQWRTSGDFLSGATSGSCAIRTKLTVFGGTWVHCSGGETKLGADWVNLAGMMDPSSIAGEVSVNPGTAGAVAGGACAPACIDAATEIARIAQISNSCFDLILISSLLKFV